MQNGRLNLICRPAAPGPTHSQQPLVFKQFPDRILSLRHAVAVKEQQIPGIDDGLPLFPDHIREHPQWDACSHQGRGLRHFLPVFVALHEIARVMTGISVGETAGFLI